MLDLVVSPIDCVFVALLVDCLIKYSSGTAFDNALNQILNLSFLAQFSSVNV